MTEKLTRDMVEAARVIAAETGSFWTDQLNNTDQLAAYHAMAEEIWTQTGGRIDGFVQSVGTAASRPRRRGAPAPPRRPDQASSPWSPSESPVLSGGETGAHKIDGIGAGFVVPLWHDDIADEIEQVSTRGGDGHGSSAWPARRACSPGPRPAPMWSPPCGWPSSLALTRPWSPSCATPG